MRDDMKLRESKAKECMIDASKIAEELHNEQELTGVHENDCKLLESKMKDLQVFNITRSFAVLINQNV